MTSSVSSVILINVPFLGYLFVVDCYILPYAQTCLEWIGKYDTPNLQLFISHFIVPTSSRCLRTLWSVLCGL